MIHISLTIEEDIWYLSHLFSIIWKSTFPYLHAILLACNLLKNIQTTILIKKNIVVNKFFFKFYWRMQMFMTFHQYRIQRFLIILLNNNNTLLLSTNENTIQRFFSLKSNIKESMLLEFFFHISFKNQYSLPCFH